MELIHKCQDCRKELELFEIHTIPGEDFTDPFTGLKWAIGKKFCAECYKNNTTATTTAWQEQYTKIDNLVPNTTFSKVKAIVVEKVSEEKKSKNGRELKLGKFEVEDSSGKIILTLWADDIERVKAGNVLIIENGYVREFNNDKHLTLGKGGSLTVLK